MPRQAAEASQRSLLLCLICDIQCVAPAGQDLVRELAGETPGSDGQDAGYTEAKRHRYFCELRNSTRLRRSCLDRICPKPSGIGDRAARRVLMSAFLIVTAPLSGELRTICVSVSLLSTPA